MSETKIVRVLLRVQVLYSHSIIDSIIDTWCSTVNPTTSSKKYRCELGGICLIALNLYVVLVLFDLMNFWSLAVDVCTNCQTADILCSCLVYFFRLA